MKIRIFRLMKRRLTLTVLILCAIGGIFTASLAQAKEFRDVTDEAGVNFVSTGGGAAFGDYDNDGYLNIFLVNKGSHVLYHNNGNGKFTDATGKAGVRSNANNAGFGFDALFFDYDNDGYLNLYVASWGPNVLYQNNGDGTFTDVTSKAGVGDAGNAWSVVALDYDLDGRQAHRQAKRSGVPLSFSGTEPLPLAGKYYGLYGRTRTGFIA